MIDLHCHILPGLDDGSRSLEESLSMARTAVEDGIHTVVASPHAFNGRFVNPAPKIRSGVKALQDAFLRNNMDLRLCPGADVHLSPHLLQKIKSGDACTINDSGKYILLELPSQHMPFGARDEIFNLVVHGITPVITHPERLSFLQYDLQVLYDLIRMGALCQITAMSILGEFGEMARQCSETLLRRRLAHVIASDAHSPRKRPPVLSGAVEVAADILGSAEEAERMVDEVPRAIISGRDLQVEEPRPPTKGLSPGPGF